MDEITFVFWHWWILAIFLLAAELFVSGFYLLWMAIAGFITGSLLWLLPNISLAWQGLIFSLFSCLSIIFWRRHFLPKMRATDHPLLNRRGEQYIGRTFTLIEAIENGEGKIKAGDTLWKVRGEDCPAQTKVTVKAVDGTVFLVEKKP